MNAWVLILCSSTSCSLSALRRSSGLESIGAWALTLGRRHVLDSGKCSCTSKHEYEFRLICSSAVRAKTSRKEEHSANLCSFPLHLAALRANWFWHPLSRERAQGMTLGEANSFRPFWKLVVQHMQDVIHAFSSACPACPDCRKNCFKMADLNSPHQEW